MRPRPRPVPAAVLGMLAIAALAAAWIDPTALCALPALALALLMALRPYAGERALRRLRRMPPAGRRPRSEPLPCVGRGEVVLPRGGLLLARALAVRPPPGALRAAA